MKKITGFTGGLIILGLMLGACTTDEGGGSVSEAALIAKWLFTKQDTKGTITITMTGYPPQQENIDTSETLPSGQHWVEFKSDHTYSANYPQDTSMVMKRAGTANETGTWSLSGSVVTTTNSSGEKTAVRADINGNTAKFMVAVDTTMDVLGAKMDMDMDVTLHATKQ